MTEVCIMIAAFNNKSCLWWNAFFFLALNTTYWLLPNHTHSSKRHTVNWGIIHSLNSTDNASHRSGYSEAIGPHYTEGTPHTNNHTLVHSDHSTFTMDRWQSLILLYIIQRTLARSHTSVGLCSASGSSWRRPAPSRAQVSSPPPWERNRSRAEWSPSSNADGMML